MRRRASNRSLKYNPDQPRVPAGEPGAGQWAEGDGASGQVDQAIAPIAVAEVIPICITVGRSLSSDPYGNPTHKITYECPDGWEFSRSGYGHSPRGFLLDPRAR